MAEENPPTPSDTTSGRRNTIPNTRVPEITALITALVALATFVADRPLWGAGLIGCALLAAAWVARKKVARALRKPREAAGELLAWAGGVVASGAAGLAGLVVGVLVLAAASVPLAADGSLRGTGGICPPTLQIRVVTAPEGVELFDRAGREFARDVADESGCSPIRISTDAMPPLKDFYAGFAREWAVPRAPGYLELTGPRPDAWIAATSASVRLAEQRVENVASKVVLDDLGTFATSELVIAVPPQAAPAFPDGETHVSAEMAKAAHLLRPRADLSESALAGASPSTGAPHDPPTRPPSGSSRCPRRPDATRRHCCAGSARASSSKGAPCWCLSTSSPRSAGVSASAAAPVSRADRRLCRTPWRAARAWSTR